MKAQAREKIDVTLKLDLNNPTRTNRRDTLIHINFQVPNSNLRFKVDQSKVSVKFIDGIRNTFTTIVLPVNLPNETLHCEELDEEHR